MKKIILLIAVSLTIRTQAQDPVAKAFLDFIRTCDCSYNKIVFLDNKQIGDVQCICPGHIIKDITVACSNTTKKAIKVLECAADSSVILNLEQALEQKNNLEKQALENGKAQKK